MPNWTMGWCCWERRFGDSDCWDIGPSRAAIGSRCCLQSRSVAGGARRVRSEGVHDRLERDAVAFCVVDDLLAPFVGPGRKSAAGVRRICGGDVLLEIEHWHEVLTTAAGDVILCLVPEVERPRYPRPPCQCEFPDGHNDKRRSARRRISRGSRCKRSRRQCNRFLR